MCIHVDMCSSTALYLIKASISVYTVFNDALVIVFKYCILHLKRKTSRNKINRKDNMVGVMAVYTIFITPFSKIIVIFVS